jgi:hypothetical protein
MPSNVVDPPRVNQGKTATFVAPPMKTESIIISGADTVRLLTAALVEDSMWFSVDPLPDTQYVVMVKDEDLCRVVARLRGLQPGKDPILEIPYIVP